MKKYGLIGYPLGHSFSKRFFSEKFSREEITDCEYENYPLTDIAQVKDLHNTVPGLAGINITIPYKEAILPYLRYPDATVAAIGACNCIRIINGEFYGFNTDVYGFERSLKTKLEAHHQQALVLGTGGASKAVCFVLEQLAIPYLLVSRSAKGQGIIDYESLTEDIYSTHTLIINTTPVGMHPLANERPPLNYEQITKRHFLFDLIYNPEQTLFLKAGTEKEATTQNGYDMLIFQAEKSWKIWNEQPPGQ